VFDVARSEKGTVLIELVASCLVLKNNFSLSDWLGAWYNLYKKRGVL
jgi:hypothetical protein